MPEKLLPSTATTKVALPDENWTVARTKEWLTENGISYPNNAKKADLLALVEVV